jgi:hypothetical protein
MMVRAMPADDRFDDIGPDPDMELEIDESVEFAPDFHVALGVPFTGNQLSAIEAYGKEHGVNAIQAVQRLVDEALAAQPQSRR